MAIPILALAALAFQGGPLAARQACAPRAPRLAVRMHEGVEHAAGRELRVASTPELAAIAQSRRETRKEAQPTQPRPLIRITAKWIAIVFVALVGSKVMDAIDFWKRRGKENDAPVWSGPPPSAWKCDNCSYEIYPARGREAKFFGDKFKCPMCGSPKESFYDLTNDEDPRNWAKDDPRHPKDDAGGAN
ncbi:hypothetical protein T492DRAFT_838539 [Pavlovales sp. CCMP2436]|nr:hypothetical protein T492DRAFT_838539 [Pavlovales sp. CCMP2436]